MARGYQMFDWTEERIKRITELWLDGWTSTAIAQKLHVSRRAVSGRLNRLGRSSRMALAPRRYLRCLLMASTGEGLAGPRRSAYDAGGLDGSSQARFSRRADPERDEAVTTRAPSGEKTALQTRAS